MVQKFEADKVTVVVKWMESVLVSILSTFAFTSGVVYSLQAIFFPLEAESKGANSLEYGVVFAIYELILLIASPVLGAHIHLFHVKTLICFGTILCGSSTILFGLTYKLESLWGFLLSCSVLRVFEAIGASSLFMGALVFITTEFPQSVALYSGIIDTAFAIGSGIGPSIGAALFQFGGFNTPFLCVGGGLLLLTLLFLFFIPKEGRRKGGDEEVGGGTGFGFIHLLHTPSVLLYSFIVTTMGAAVTFLISMLEPHLRLEGKTTNEIGYMFLIMNGVFVMAAPMCGWMVDRMKEPGLLTLLGLFFLATGSVLIGPASFIPLKPNLVFTVTGLVCVGLGQGVISISAFIQMLNEAKRNGFTEEVSRNGLVSGLYLASYCLGGVLGPPLGGFLVTHFSFAHSCDFFLIMESVLMVSLGLFLRSTHRLSRKRQGESKIGRWSNQMDSSQISLLVNE